MDSSGEGAADRPGAAQRGRGGGSGRGREGRAGVGRPARRGEFRIVGGEAAAGRRGRGREEEAASAEGEGGRGARWRRLRPAVRLSPPEEDEAEDRAPLTQFAGGGQLPGAGGPLVLPIPAAGRAKPAEQDEGE